MTEDAKTELVMLVIDGADEHHGHVMARALVDKLDRFLTTFAGYERAYLQLRARRTDFEVAAISHNSPTELGLRPVTRVASHHPPAVVSWTFQEWDKIARGVPPDERIDEDLIGEFAALSKPPENAAFERFRIGYGRHHISLNETAFANAERLRRASAESKPKLPWRAGASRGTITGELRSVLDAESERQIVIVPPIGPTQVRCTFTDSMRTAVKDNLWQFVRLTGLFHYDDRSPHPFLVQVETLSSLNSPEDQPHLADRIGIFRDGVYETGVTDGLHG